MHLPMGTRSYTGPEFLFYITGIHPIQMVSMKVSNPLTVQNTLLKNPGLFAMCIIFIHIIVVHSEEKLYSHPKR